MGRPNEPDVLLKHIKRYHNYITEGKNDNKANINQFYFLSSCHTVLIAISIIISLIVLSNILLPSPAAKGKKTTPIH